MRAQDDIQFAPVNVPPRSVETPEWLRALSAWLREVLGPIGEALAEAWPVLKWVLLASAILMVVYILYRLIEPLIRLDAGDDDAAETAAWQPDERAALALLEDADRLASNGDYDAATHLLLQRSVAQIAAAKPDLVEPATTARELAAMPTLPADARKAFGTIASRVEQSLFALSALNQTDWQEARGAYAEFALQRIDGRILDRSASVQLGNKSNYLSEVPT